MEEAVYIVKRIEAANPDKSWKGYERLFVEESRKVAKKLVLKDTKYLTTVPHSGEKIREYTVKDDSGRTVKVFRFATVAIVDPYVTMRHKRYDPDAPRGEPYALIRAYSVNVNTNAESLMYSEYVTVGAV